MKVISHITSFLLLIIISMVVAQAAAAAGPTIDHRFYLELPDGSQKEMKGPRLMRAWQDEGQDPNVGVTCRYTEYKDQEVNWQRDVSDGYFCSTNESCYTEDWGAPFLPNYFNADAEVYTTNDSSYYAFYNETFTDMLSKEAPYYASIYDSENIRGFEGAKWVGHVDWETSKGDGSVTLPDNPPRTPLNHPGWNQVPGFDGDQVWTAGEVYHNTEGGNVLQGKITWVLKLPEEKEQPKEELSCDTIGTAGAWNSNDVTVGQKVSFWCMAVDGADSYEFRLIEPDENIVSLAFTGEGANPGQMMSSQYTVQKTGNYTAQCRVCKGNDCTAWGAAGQN